MVFGAHPDRISMLFFLSYVKAAGGLVQLLETRGAAQDSTLRGGAQQLSERLRGAVEAAGGEVRLGAQAERVVAVGPSGSLLGVECRGGGPTLRARAVVVALSPKVALESICFEPRLPERRRQLVGQLALGAKFVLVYETAWWRGGGLSGSSICSDASEEWPIFATFDYVHEAHGEQRRLHACVGRMLASGRDSEAAARPPQCVEFLERQWSEDGFARGCPVDLVPAGLQPAGPPSWNVALARPCEARLFFASTDTATSWTGYMEGAVQAGGRAAKESISTARCSFPWMAAARS
ncbi:monoamine oxidase [Emiliania huxleyi CCMP1516]|uniref:Amine oxidase n=2 Tax=Emiliania huxleyi TaxID=2903 RepID=A0A0D3J105_EMIH1|nr:monoamine oxidase [Emiliania huxleyi CCMP1516]EOD17190.1 monoamine oxidase [Emiliania huxleyi CCMP1516]|eukprot:XP_005769619.1 monoamine oxidase [Emiliania huxleyi CCMP1516]